MGGLAQEEGWSQDLAFRLDPNPWPNEPYMDLLGFVPALSIAILGLLEPTPG